MFILNCIYGLLTLSLCITSIHSDITLGLVRNKSLLLFTILAFVIDILYFWFFAAPFFLSYIINVILVTCISVLLFVTHSFAGGDAKLAIVLALCYPADFYLSYAGIRATLVIAIGLALLGGYIYLLVSSLTNLVKKRNFSFSYFRNSLFQFLKSFFVAMVYISAVNLLVMLIYKKGVYFPSWIVRLVCLALAWIVGQYPFFHKRNMVCCIILFDVLGTIIIRELPFSTHPLDYLLVVILLLCQMSITTNLYETIKVSNLKKGMILSTASSLLLQGSRIHGLPNLSKEDLSSRLTEDEVNSISRWAKNHNVGEISVVKKIPFAVFLALGYVCYFFIWCVI